MLASGVNGIYLCTVDLCVVNVRPTLGVRAENGVIVNWHKFIIYAMVLRGIVACLVMLSVFCLDMPRWVPFLVTFMAVVNYGVATSYFVKLSNRRGAMRPYIVAQELSAVLLLSIPFLAVLT